ncbi:hypothetical protein [Anaerophaga thermohalophila]|uniref:hypothetical protein n=1 Tax=Anaerophaga thermohalophila TaxID=177400 RepID=UPI001146D547|nr:hypothetical protein [Anaerophaga thermohalophila]
MQRAEGMGQRVRRVEWQNGRRVEGLDGKCGIPSSAHQLTSLSARHLTSNCRIIFTLSGKKCNFVPIC